MTSYEHEPVNQGRREAMRGATAAAFGALAAAPLASNAATRPGARGAASARPAEARYWLANVTLEDGFVRGRNNEVTATRTRTANLLIEGGRISRVADAVAADGLPRYDVQGALALPSFADMHIHLDKGHYGGPWKSATPFVSVAARIREEEEFLVPFVAGTARKARALLDLVAGYGTTHVRVQCNVDPIQGLQNRDKVLEALNGYRSRFDWDLVAFPQHGLVRNAKLMDEALRGGFTILGGLDPSGIDGDVERSLNTTMELAVKHNVPIDMHLHEPGHQGAFVITRLAKLVEEAKWQGRVCISHAYCLGQLSGGRLDDLIARMAAVKMQVTTTAPIDLAMPPVGKLAAKGVVVNLATDCINDHWSAYGSGSMIERASRLGEANDWNDEYQLNRALRYITRGVTPLDDDGKLAWPKAGDRADIALLDASCSAEVVARRSPVTAVLRQGVPSVWNVARDA